MLPPGWFICLAQRHGICHCCPCASEIFMTCTLVVLTALYLCRVGVGKEGFSKGLGDFYADRILPVV